MEIFMDGGCRGNGQETSVGGWAFSVWGGPYGNGRFDKAGAAYGATNNTMELQAAIEAMRWLATSAPQPVVLWLDSQYVLKGITEWISGWVRKGWVNSQGAPVANKTLWLELQAEVAAREREGFCFTWKWIKGHSGCPGNERADQLASQAMDALAGGGGKAKKVPLSGLLDIKQFKAQLRAYPPGSQVTLPAGDQAIVLAPCGGGAHVFVQRCADGVFDEAPLRRPVSELSRCCVAEQTLGDDI